MVSIPFLESVSIAWEQVISSLNDFDAKIDDPNNLPYDQLKELGINLFLSFCELGESLKAHNITSNQVSQYLDYVNPIIKAVEKHQEIIKAFISIYGFNEIDFEGRVPVRRVCGIRSGIQFMIEYFSNITNNFDAVLESFKEDIDEYDRVLHVWIDNGFRFPVPSNYIPINIPQAHWWWPF